MKNNVKRYVLLLAFGLTYGFMYTLPYMKFSFYDHMIAAMNVTNEQLGQLLSVYAMACTLSYLPGGWIADRFKPKTVLVVSSFANAALCFLFMLTYQNYTIATIIWILAAFTGGFAFWPALLKGIRLIGSEEEQGRMFGIFEALNGVASIIANFTVIYVLSIFADNLIIGFKSAVGVMGTLCAIAGVLLLVFFDESLIKSHAGEESSQINVKQFLEVFKQPGVWITSILMFGQVLFITGMSYLTPYSTSILGLSLTAAASIGAIRTYATRFIGGPLGGFVTDKVFKSASKGQLFSFGLCALTMGVFLILPPGQSHVLIIGLMLLIATALYMVKGPLYAVVPELKVPTAITGTALAVITLIGYLPDMFAHTLFGRWLDVYGDAGYNRIFISSIAMALFCMAVAFVGIKIANKQKQKQQSESSAD